MDDDDEVGLNRGPWTSEEDAILAKYIETQGEGRWRSVPKAAGLLRCGKSCRLRWVNYLRPAVKRGNISEDEENLIIKLHFLLGNRWSLIAGRMPGRTDNEIKNYWNTHMTKKLKKLGINPNTHKPLCTPQNNQITVVRTTSVFQSQDSVISKCLKPTSQKTISTHEVPFDPGDKLVYHTLTTSDGAMSAEITSSSTKIIKTSEMVNCPISRTTHVGSESMEQASSFSMNSEHQRKSVQAISTFISVEDDSFSLSWSSPSSVLCTHDFSSSSKCDSPSSLFTNSKCSENRFTRPPHNFAPAQMEISNEQPHDFSSTLQLITDQTNVNSPTSVEFFHDSTANKIMMTNTGSSVHVPETLKLGMNSGQAADQLSMLDIPEADGEFWNYIKKQEVANYSESESPFSIFTADWWDGLVQVVRSSDADQSPNCNTSNDSFTLSFPDMCELELESCRRPVIFPQHLDHHEYCGNL